jgi:hypothetical protein
MGMAIMPEKASACIVEKKWNKKRKVYSPAWREKFYIFQPVLCARSIWNPLFYCEGRNERHVKIEDGKLGSCEAGKIVTVHEVN